MHPTRRPVALLALLCLVTCAAPPRTGAAVGTAAGANAFEVSIDGVACDGVVSWQGGEFVADLAVHAPVGSAAPAKNVANIRVTPLVLNIDGDLSPALVTLVNEFLTQGTARHTLSVTRLDFNGQPKAGSFEAINALVTEVDFGGLDASAKDAVHVTLVFASEQVRATSTAPVAASAGSTSAGKQSLASNYRFAMAPLDCTRISKIAAFTAKRTPAANSIGIFRESTATPGPIELSNLVLTISEASAQSWDQWANDFFVQGHHLESDEKSATLTYLAPDMKAELLSLQFTHVGFVGLSRGLVAKTSQNIARFTAELYYEGVSVSSSGNSSTKTPGTASTTPPAATTGSTAPDPNTASSSPPPADATPVGPASGTLPANGSTVGPVTGAPAGTVGSILTPPAGTLTDPALPSVANPLLNGTTPATLPVPAASTPTLSRQGAALSVPNATLANVVPAAPATVPGVTAPTAGSLTAGPVGGTVAGNPADQGAHDLTDFPRLDGLIRKSFTSAYWESSADESADYVSKLSVNDLVAQYEDVLKGAGWEEGRKYENGNAADFSHNFRLILTKTVQSADLQITQTKSGGSEVAISISTKRVGILSALAATMKGVAVDVAPADGSPNDQGARDPAAFPRIARSVRKSYSSSGSAKAPEENVVYRAKVPIAQVEAFFVNQLNQSDWEQSVRRESGDPLGGSHEIDLTWSLGRRSVRLYLKEIEPAISEITATLSTAAP